MMPIDPTDSELDYRAKNYQDFEAVERKQIACATCGTNLSSKLGKPGSIFVHPFMTTLQCKKCSNFYGDGDFSMDEDGDDKYCRMCGNGGELYICGSEPCPYGFCQKCIDRYVGKDSAEVQADDWKCLHCNCKPLWEVRAVCAVILLEKARKRSKHRKIPTRGQVHKSNDDYSHSEDSNNDFEISKRIERRFLRSKRNSENKKSKVLEKIRSICDSGDDSPDHFGKMRKALAVKKASNFTSRRTEFCDANQTSSAKRKGAESLKEGKGLSRKSASSSNESSDCDATPQFPKKHASNKLGNAYTEPEAKLVKKQSSHSSNSSIKQHQKTSHSSQNHPKSSRIREISQNLSDTDSDSDSNHDSAKDFVQSKKKRNLKTLEEKSNGKDLIIQKKKQNNVEGSNPKFDTRHSNSKFSKVVAIRRESPSESKDTNRNGGSSSSEDSNTNAMRKKTAKSARNTSESDEEINDSNKRASSIEEGTLRVSRRNKRYVDPEKGNNDDVTSAKIRAEVSTSSTKEFGRALQTKRLSTKPLCPTTRTSFSLNSKNELLERRKACIRQSYAKLASTEDCVTKDQATIMKNYVGDLISKMKMFGESLCVSADELATRYLENNNTDVPAVSEPILKCALFMIRSKKALDTLEHRFEESYEDWCRKSKVKSILSDAKKIVPITSNEVKSVIEEGTSADISKKDRISRHSDAGSTTDYSAENSDTSCDDQKCNINKQPAGEVNAPRCETGSANLHTKKKITNNGKNSGSSESLDDIATDREDPVDRNSDEDSKNAMDVAMSDCDSREIFSEDESRKQANKEDQPATRKGRTQSTPVKRSKKQSTESSSEELDDVDLENTTEIEGTSLQSDNAIETPKKIPKNDRQDNQEKLVESIGEKHGKGPSRVDEKCIDDTHKLDASLDDTFDDSNAFVEESTLNLNEKSNDLSGSDRTIADCSTSTESLSITGKSALRNTRVQKSPKTIQMGNAIVHGDEVKTDKKRKSGLRSKHDDKLEISVQDSSMNSDKRKPDSQLETSIQDSSIDANEITEDLSDCDTAIIFTQFPSNDSETNSNAEHIAKSTETLENLGGTEESQTSDSEVRSDPEMPLPNDNNCEDDVLSPSKEISNSPETISRHHKGVIDSDTNDNLQIEASGESQESGIGIENHSPALLLDGKENDSRHSIRAVEEKKAGESEKKQATATDDDSEEVIKNKRLESDSESSEDNAGLETSSFVLKVNSDSEEYAKESLNRATDSATVIADMSGGEKKKQNPRMTTIKRGMNTPNLGPEDNEVSQLNDLAKHRLLSSSDSSSSEDENESLMLNKNANGIDSHSTSSQENDEITPGSDIGSESTSIKAKRKKFNLEKNHYYKTDKKLQMDCKVVVRRLKEKVLDQFRQLLGKSREHQEWEDFKSLVDLNNIRKRKRGTRESNQSDSSSESSSSKGQLKKPKSKQVQEKEETLLEHLEKMKNGENYCNPSGDETDDDNDIATKIRPEDNAEADFLTTANKSAKERLIQSSDSENEMQDPIENSEEQEEPELETQKKEKKEKDVSNEEAVDSASNNENDSNTEKDNEETNIDEENDETKENEDSDSDRTRERKKMKEGLAKRNWRLTDSDSSDEEKKWNKSQLNKKEENSTEEKQEEAKQKKKVKRRVLGSDSDSVKLTDCSDDSDEDVGEEKNSSSDSENSSELFENLRKKRRRKRNAGGKSDSDSDSDQDEKPSKLKRKRIKKMASDSDSDNDGLTNSPGKLHRKNIRKVLKDKQVADVTKIAGKEEEERLRRIADRQKLYNEMYELKLASEAKVDKLILDFDEETKKELISVHEDLVNRLKPHQAQGIKFMWDACFESLERTKSTKGSGCIVAHCMGLGKTFQVVTLAHTLLTHPETGIKTIMVICPLSTVLNWVNEFKKWLGDINNDEDVEVFEMTKMKKNFERKYQLEKWQRAGGVMVLGYEMFRLLSNQTGKKMRKSLHESILKCLVDPGPDLIVCDEGHLLKNEDTALSKAMRRVKTLRRIVLTGTPLQNNLVEYHCMVQFVKPNLLGTKKEFLNRFVNPITNGQFDDSTEYDVKLMKKRAHVLHKMLEGSVQRFDYSVLTPFLPPKQEYVITVRLADIQIKLYQYYLDNFSRKKVGAGTSLFADFQSLQRIWTHPIVLRMNAEKVEKLNEKRRMDETTDSEGSLKDFLDDGSDEKTTSSDDSDVQSAHSSSEGKTEKPRRGTRANPIDLDTVQELQEEVPLSGEWWSQFVEPEHFEDMRISSKLVLLFAILKECEQIGDKVLVFSQSLYALSLIEEFLGKIDDETQRGMCSELIDGHSGSWSLGLDYFRLDGQTPPENRSHYCKIFNNPKNSRARLFLISTRAGGLGINLTAANRVIIFDASWNPSHDVQSIFRIYRFGQRKPCYVYRFLAQGTMEEKIYNRQVTKLSLSCRVVDEQQIERHYSNHDLAELYQFEPNTSKEKSTLNLPKDRLLAEIFRKYEDRIETFHEHDSLLENKAEEELDEEERKEAWKEYEDERTGRKVYGLNNTMNQNFGVNHWSDMVNINQADIANRATLSGINIDTLQALIRKDYPNTTPEQQTMMTQRAIIDMYAYMENEAIRQQQIAAAANSFTYPTVSNVGPSTYTEGTAMTPAQRQYALQQQQQRHQIMVQRELQANYAKRFGNVRGPALSATPARAPQIVNVQLDDNDVIEVPTTPPMTAGPTPSSSVPATSTSAPAAAEKNKRQEE